MQDSETPRTAIAADGSQAEVAVPTARELPPAARRALAEAEARRRAKVEEDRPPERGGRDGPEPVRYGDWEKNGIISDF